MRKFRTLVPHQGVGMHSAREAFDEKLAAGCSPRVALIAGMKAFLQNFNPGVELAPGQGASMVRDLEDEIGLDGRSGPILESEAAAYCAGLDHAVSLFGPDPENGPAVADFHSVQVALVRLWAVPGTIVATAVLDDRHNAVLASAMFELAEVELADDPVDLTPAEADRVENARGAEVPHQTGSIPTGGGWRPTVPAPADANGYGPVPCPICGKVHTVA